MNQSILSKLEQLSMRLEEINALLSDQSIASDQNKFRELSIEHSQLTPVNDKYKSYLSTIDDIEAAEKLLSEQDDEMKQMAEEEISSGQKVLEQLELDLKKALLPKDPNDSRNIILEIRAGTGGDEASIFSGDLYRMYTKFAQDKKWKISVVDTSEGTAGGFKEVIFEIAGEDVYGVLKYESGVHRVQRVPQTETQGRVHTSAATVMVLPEAEEFDVEINMSEVRVDYFCSSGPGGQSVNTTYSAVRLTHEPTGVVAQCQDQKSQHKNKEKAMKVLRSRLYEIELNKRMESDSQKRNELVKSGDRSAKIRTYNYPQGRVTDHRIGLTLYDLPKILDGDVSKLIDEIQLFINTERLKEAGEV